MCLSGTIGKILKKIREVGSCRWMCPSATVGKLWKQVEREEAADRCVCRRLSAPFEKGRFLLSSSLLAAVVVFIVVALAVIVGVALSAVERASDQID